MGILIGTAGNDSLNGTSGKDTLMGQGGSDTLTGGIGSDTYIFSKGSGVDIIYDVDTNAVNTDVVYFTDIKSTDITAIKTTGLYSQDLLLTYGANDQLTIYDYFTSYYYQIEEIKFSDGVVWKLSDVTDRVVIEGTEYDDYLAGYLSGSPSRIFGFDGDDIIFGGSANDSLDGGDGNDAMWGDLGNDTLVGGGGIDYMNGEGGDDTYVISSSTFDIDDSAGNDTAIVSVSFVKIPSYIENVIYVDGAQALPYWIDALLNDSAAGNRYQRLMGSGNTINYAYPTALPSYDTDADDAYQFTGFNAAQKTFSKQALTYISTVLDLSFVEVSDPAAINTISFGNNYQFYSSAYAYLPSTSFLSRDLFLDIATPSNLTPADGGQEALILIHELGHSLGLEHPFSTPSTDAPHLTSVEDSTLWTVMSYNDSADQYHLEYSDLDIAALQYIYGPSSKARTGNNTYEVNSLTSNFIWDGAGVDTLDARTQTQDVRLSLEAGYWGFIGSKASNITSAGQVTVNFGSVIENLVGGSGNDYLYGNTHANRIEGGNGKDILFGGDGNDTLMGGHGNDRLIGEAGIDTASFADSTAAVTAAINGIVFSGSASSAAGADTLEGIENLIGSAYADSLTGNSLGNRLEGGEGNDSLDGDSGADTLLGGAGNDLYIVDNIADVIIESNSQGSDIVFSGISFVLGANVENLQLTAGTAINGTGNSLNNFFWAGAGNNVIDGAGGSDTVSYAYSGAAVVANLSSRTATGGSGNDSLLSIESLVGSDYADTLTGNGLDNMLQGGAGNDTLNGGGGMDHMIGGAGDDQYMVDSIYDDVTEEFSSGIDTVFSSVNFMVGDHVENLRLLGTSAINGRGNGLANLIVANAGDNMLWGGGGSDTVSYATSSAGVIASLTTRKATGGSGNDSIEGFWNITGSNYADSLTGNTLANQLDGAGGSDTLNGGTGADTLTGGSGSDTFFVENTGDVVIETGSDTLSGTDTVYASISYTLTANVENLRINSTANINATGNELNNILFAGAGNNILNGAGGIDTANYGNTSAGVNVSLGVETAQNTGNSGTDTLISIENLTGSNYNDTLQGSNADNIIEGGTGTDTMSYANAAAAVTASLASKSASGGAGNDTLLRIENLIGSSYNDSLTGSSIANILSAGSGNDSLNGSSGNDTLSGGDGNDLILGGAGQDQLTGGAGADTFDFNTLAEMGITNASWDSITDFSGAEGDRIDLSTLDANTTTGGNQSFSFIGSAASFTAAGQVRYDVAAGMLYGSVDADLDAEFAIALVGNPAFIADYLIA